MTLALVARDPEGRLGVVMCSSSPAASPRSTQLRPAVGAIASQNFTNPELNSRVLDLLAAGACAERALRMALEEEAHPEYRQLMVVDQSGGTAVHSGSRALGVTRHVCMRNAAAGGDGLVDESVVTALLSGYLSSAAGAFEQRLLDGLIAAMNVGGQVGGIHSAGIHVVDDDVSWPVTDLRVDWHIDPVQELLLLWQLWAPQQGRHRQHAVDPTTRQLL